MLYSLYKNYIKNEITSRIRIKSLDAKKIIKNYYVVKVIFVFKDFN